MWRVLRQTFLGRRQNVRQMPSATTNQPDATEPQQPCVQSTFNRLRSFGINSGQGFGHSTGQNGSTHHQNFHWERFGCQGFRPCLVDTISWLGVSFFLGMRLQSFFISGTGQEKVSLRQRISKAIDYISRDLASSDVLHALPSEEVSTRQHDPSNQLSKVPDENLLNQVELVASNLDQVELVASNFAGLLENQRGVDAASSHLDIKAFSHFKQAANSLGCPKAHYNLGVCYETGHGTSPDLHLAAQHYLMAAREGHASALYNLGMFYLQGLGGLECNETHALTCMQKAASKLLPEALLYMGVYFHERNKSTKAVKYFSQAAQQNNAEAQFYLGLCYHHGWGVAISQSQARQCFAAASSAGHTDAARWLALHQESRPIHISFSASDLKSQDSSSSINPKSPSAYLDVVMSPVFCAAAH